MIYSNLVDLYYYKDTGEITPLFKGKTRNYKTIKKYSIWTTYHDNFINSDGYAVKIDSKSLQWFGKE